MTEGHREIADVLAEWQTRLLQLDRRNNLLYFRPGRRAVRIVETSPDDISEELITSRGGLSFDYAEPARRLLRGQDRDDDNGANDAEPYVVEGDIRTDVDPLDLQRRLRTLRRKDKEWEEEQGLNVLFLAVGFLEWVDEDGEEARSPLILIPCDLTQASPRDSFYLLRESDDAEANATLIYALSRQGITLADFGDMEPSEYIRRVAELVSKREGWRVTDDVYLSTFAYSKMPMWKDLERMRVDGIDHPLVRQLAGDTEAASTTSPDLTEFPDEKLLNGGRLDDLLDVRDQYSVLPADFSQLRAIELVRTGANLVVHGPPGTGKSQTIANMIASLLADGKRVLFVSEKTAALDVVKRRLTQCDLGVFCLDLHSERGKKSSVYEQLRESRDDPRTIDSRQFSFESLISKRTLLNKVVRVLHEVRQPLGKTVFDMQSRFAELQHLPRVQFPVGQPTELREEFFAEANQIAERIARRQDEFQEHTTSRWLPLTQLQVTLQLADLIRDDMDVVRRAAGAIREELSVHARWLDLPAPTTGDSAAQLAELIDHLCLGKAVPEGWLEPEALPRVRAVAKSQRELQQLRRELSQQVTEAFGSDRLPIDYHGLSAMVQLSGAEETALQEFLGAVWKEKVVSPTTQLVRSAETVVRSIDDLVSQFPTLADGRCETAFEVWQHLSLAMENADRIAQLAPVPIGWTEAGGLARVERELESAKSMLGDLTEAEQSLHERFSDSIVEAVDDGILVRYRADYQSFWRRLGRGFRRDQRLLRGHLKAVGKVSLTSAIDAIELALRVRRLRAEWAGREETLTQTLGSRFNGRRTDWQTLERDIEQIEKLHDSWPAERHILASLLVDPDAAARIRKSLETVEMSKNQCSQSLEAIGREQLMGDEQLVYSVRDRAKDATAPLAAMQAVADELREQYQRPIKDLDELTVLLGSGARLLDIEKDAIDLEPSLSSDFGDRFQGFATDWDDVDEALGWTGQLQSLLPAERGNTFRAHVATPSPAAEYRSAAASVRSAVQNFIDQLGTIEIRFDPLSTLWGSWRAAHFNELEEWADDLSPHAETASGWIEYQVAVRDLNETLEADVVSQIRSATDQAELVPKIVQRRMIGAWLDSVYQEEPVLRDFGSKDHNDVRLEFEKLDRALPMAARAQVRERCFSRYPSRETTGLRAGQLGTLRGELSKKRRQLPVRKLFARIPQVLQAMKPVFLMSPLAVSKYLSRDEPTGETIGFDTVIFDEASQVFPEDAVPAIARGEQAVIVGDEHQLPPTNFFRRSFADDEEHDVDDDDDEESDAFAGRESILDAMVGMVGRNVAEEYLGMHYRSRHDSLIRYSNHYFYSDRLLVFPAPEPAASGAGVSDIYLPDARYDPQAGRINRGEAERTVDEVFRLMGTCPDNESIGVVTLNRPQADCIRDLIDLRRLDERDLDELFAEDRQEPFFVKNLENVQGDERDHVILSIGYGPTVGSGAVPNRFGPINREGGERRLNVAVSRSRKSMTVVHSIRPTDIHSERTGARLLRRYLEYVADPVRAFESQVTVDPAAETETTFEEAVERALIGRGYRLDRQVGVSGYRIDLAALSEDGSSYDLGIECDGARYHSAPAARDRDWLRQSVLEGLGWTIHRVWSTAWIRNPEAELAAIEEAISKSRSRAFRRVPSAPDDSPLEAAGAAAGPDKTAAPASGKEPPSPDLTEPTSDEPPLLFEEYIAGSLADIAVGPELQYEVDATLERLIVRIVEREMPVHIDLVVSAIRSPYGLGRAGRIIRNRIERAMKEAVRHGKVSWAPLKHGEAPPPNDDWWESKSGRSAFLMVGGTEEPVRPKRPAVGQPARKIEHISDRELEAGLLCVTEAMFGGERETLINETARQFGYKRTGEEISKHLDGAISNLVDSGKLVDANGMLSLAEP